jgi:hypothetical protein
MVAEFGSSSLVRGSSMIMAVLAVAACANPGNEMALRAPESLVGMSKGDLLACAGVPDRTVTSGDLTFLSYMRQQTSVHRDFDWEPSPWLGPGRPMLWERDVTTYSRTYRCEATFTIRGDRVAELRYNQDRDASLCYRIVGNCVR